MYKCPTASNIILYCKEWKKTVQFYKHRLGLPVVFYNDWFVEFRLTDTSRLSIADEKRSSINSCDGSGVTLALEVEDIEQCHKNMEKIGLEPTFIRLHPWGAKVFNLYDPEGHRIEIWQPFDSDSEDAM